ncbi:MAG: 30S ribosomal protein S2 [Candidatus Aenigmarchaeota archaeon]|nr:30S ribosomal protein S2 [Candidatus Aenigmarchaeota archaeon]
MADMLVDKTQYLTAGIHIGMKTCTPYMKQFVYKIREDGLAVFNLQQVDERIKTAAGFLSTFKNVLVVSRKEAGQKAVRAFVAAVGGQAVAGRFTPGTLTNPAYKGFVEPDVIVVVDPLIDDQAIKEAKRKRIPIIALCDTFNLAKDIDYLVPANNNGRKSIALIFWILAREVLRARGQLAADAEFSATLKEFGDEDKPEGEAEEPVEEDQ